MRELITNYIQFIFSSSNQGGSMDFLTNVGGKVSMQMNEEVTKKFTNDEVYQPLK